MRQRQTQLTSVRTQLAQTRLCGTNTLKDAEQDLRSCVQRCLEKAHQSQGGAANSTRPRTTNLGIKVSSRPAVQHGETEAHRGSGYALEQRASPSLLADRLGALNHSLRSSRSRPLPSCFRMHHDVNHRVTRLFLQSISDLARGLTASDLSLALLSSGCSCIGTSSR